VAAWLLVGRFWCPRKHGFQQEPTDHEKREAEDLPYWERNQYHEKDPSSQQRDDGSFCTCVFCFWEILFPQLEGMSELPTFFQLHGSELSDS
jgi:hypothetical protein